MSTLRFGNKITVLIVMLLLQSIFMSSAQMYRKVIKVRGGKKEQFKQLVVDSLYQDSILKDSILKDSIFKLNALKDSLHKDSVKLGLITEDSSSVVTMAVIPGKKWKPMKTELPKSGKFSLVRDTISPTAHFFLSLIPGMGQVYNKQYYKVPIFVGLIGGFAAGGIIASQTYNNYRDDYYRAVDLNLPSSVTDPLQRRMKQAGTVRTIFYSAAAASYLYQIADATFHYRGYLNQVTKATVLSAVFPGAGFIYTKRYWRLPIYYGAFAAAATVVDYNNRFFVRYRDAYNALTDGDPMTEDEFHGRYTTSQLSNARDAYRRDRDLGIICMVAIYALNIIDTYVTATLMNWDMSRDLSVHVKPVLFREYAYTKSGGYASGTGLSLSVQF